MSSLNKVFLMGNLTRDPEMRTFGTGGQVCAISLAVNRRFRTSQGEDREEVCFVDVDVFGRQAENVANYLRKGSPALIEGRLRLDQWDDRQTGQKRSRLKVTAESVQFIGAPSRGSSDFGNDGAPAQNYGGGGGRSNVNESSAPYSDNNSYGGDYDSAPPQASPQQAPAPAYRNAPPPPRAAPPPAPSNDDFGGGDIDDIPF